ncbi:DgyrCDS12139 [Dimorphilus gyrociliatus]|uniref:DgyrCDS12139 n=1 Tax=Dimorphilus gyrociliatus TaxID=2664684 RepID=A0A7I8W8H4_9ANNE|nr:DgyrCDS12139 [Dimorphilus gyrociliatus]
MGSGSTKHNNSDKRKQQVYQQNYERKPSSAEVERTSSSFIVSVQNMREFPSEEEQERILQNEDSQLGFQDSSCDDIFTLIMQADEFLNRTKEFDELIEHWRSQSNSEEGKLLEYLGLRGHMQAELLQIQQLLLKLDPNLTRFNEFESSWPIVVQKLRMLLNQQKGMTGKEASHKVDDFINSGDHDSRPPLEGGGETSTARGSQTATFSANVNNTSNGTKVQASCATDNPAREEIGIQNDIQLETEEELERRHKQEEDKVNRVFQSKIIRQKLENNLGEDDLRKLLAGHTEITQALKRRQAMERDIIKGKIDMKKKLREANQNERDENKLNDVINQYLEKDSDDADLEIDPELKKKLEDEMGAVFSNINTISKEDIQNLILKTLKSMEDSSTDTGDATETFSSDSDGESNIENIEKENMNKFIRQMGQGEQDEEAIIASIKNHLLTKEELRERLALERNSHKANIDKMRRDRRSNQANAGSENENSDDGSAFGEDSKQLSELDRDLARRIASGGKLSEEELRKLLENYSKQRSSIIDIRYQEKERNNKVLQQKKAEREKRSKKKRENLDLLKDIDYSKLDVETMFELVKNKQNSGELTMEAFQDLMFAYTKRINKEKRKKQKVDTRDVSMAQATETILKEHEEQAKHIKEIHDKEASKFKKQLEERKKERRQKLN